jgi:hypothetical protein
MPAFQAEQESNIPRPRNEAAERALNCLAVLRMSGGTKVQRFTKDRGAKTGSGRRSGHLEITCKSHAEH